MLLRPDLGLHWLASVAGHRSNSPDQGSSDTTAARSQLNRTTIHQKPSLIHLAQKPEAAGFQTGISSALAGCSNCSTSRLVSLRRSGFACPYSSRGTLKTSDIGNAGQHGRQPCRCVKGAYACTGARDCSSTWQGVVLGTAPSLNSEKRNVKRIG